MHVAEGLQLAYSKPEQATPTDTREQVHVLVMIIIHPQIHPQTRIHARTHTGGGRHGRNEYRGSNATAEETLGCHGDIQALLNTCTLLILLTGIISHLLYMALGYLRFWSYLHSSYLSGSRLQKWMIMDHLESSYFGCFLQTILISYRNGWLFLHREGYP